MWRSLTWESSLCEFKFFWAAVMGISAALLESTTGLTIQYQKEYSTFSASQSRINRLTLPTGYIAENLGNIRLRGKDQYVKLFAIESNEID